eukprot:5231802-Amphidinium_carterae.1
MQALTRVETDSLSAGCYYMIRRATGNVWKRGNALLTTSELLRRHSLVTCSKRRATAIDKQPPFFTMATLRCPSPPYHKVNWFLDTIEQFLDPSST